MDGCRGSKKVEGRCGEQGGGGTRKRSFALTVVSDGSIDAEKTSRAVWVGRLDVARNSELSDGGSAQGWARSEISEKRSSLAEGRYKATAVLNR